VVAVDEDRGSTAARRSRGRGPTRPAATASGSPGEQLLHLHQYTPLSRHCNLGMKLVVSGLTYAACERA
jgi:hypothetical protein